MAVDDSARHEPMMMDAALSGRLTISEAVRLMATNGAKRFGIYPHKGLIAEGADADIIVYDPNETTTIHAEKLFTKAALCDRLYDGMSFRGRLERTILGGKTVFVDGNVIGEKGQGKFVRPDRSQIDRSF